MATGHFRHYLEHYLAPHPATQVKEIFLSTAILDFAVASVMVFEPIYLHSIGFSVRGVVLFYMALYVAYFLLLPFGGRICRRHGNEHTILYSSPFLILYYVSLFAIPFHRGFIAAALAAIVIQKVLYWPGYHANFVAWSDGQERGREVSNMAVIAAIASAAAPAFGGIMILFFGYGALFAAVAILVFVSNIPLFRTPELFEPKPFPYAAAVKRLFAKENRRRFFSFLGYGEELIALVLWPLFIITVVPDMLSVGAIVSLSVFSTIAATLYIGRICDEGGAEGALKSSSLYTAASWLIRPFISGGLGVFLIDTYYRIARNAVGVPLVMLTYGDARRSGVMEGVVFYEMALAVGKVLAAGICIVIVTVAPGAWSPIFFTAAAFTLLYSLLRDGTPKK